jgi:hypothetical protein
MGRGSGALSPERNKGGGHGWLFHWLLPLGSSGPDRITQNTKDAANPLTKVTTSSLSAPHQPRADGFSNGNNETP